MDMHIAASWNCPLLNPVTCHVTVGWVTSSVCIVYCRQCQKVVLITGSMDVAMFISPDAVVLDAHTWWRCMYVML